MSLIYTDLRRCTNIDESGEHVKHDELSVVERKMVHIYVSNWPPIGHTRWKEVL